MERRRHARTPVDLNAMLIGQKTVPKGCRVRNVSQQGMLLQCEPDGRLLTFSKGDKVEIHLTVGYADEKKSLTIPSSVRHVNEAYIYVEFQHPDLKLVELIESYRANEAYELEAAVGFGDSRPVSAKVTPITDAEPAMQADTPPLPEKKDSHKPFYYGLLTLVLVICIITGGYIYTASVDNRLSMLETITDRQTSELVEMRERAFSSTLQEGRYASLNARMTALTDAFTSLDNKLSRVVSQRIPNPPAQTTLAASNDSPELITSLARQEKTALAASQPAKGATGPAISGEQTETPSADSETDKQISDQPAEEVKTVVEAASPQPATPITGTTSDSVAKAGNTTGQVATTSHKTATPAPASRAVSDKQGPWVINLLSSPDKGYAERYAASAQSRGVALEMNSAEVKGRTYWRLQITGFSTARAAQAGAAPVKKKLGIKDVWIFKHQER